ncbi:SDR family NAD(P)-dependent oxidoreductase [Rhodococcus sp. MSC1_016]|jgi:NAD(P)-dependent dehydrogenase (short-subunit alcohol dehydrogenase family)|uniref:SDR family NAD(P)-dependent oxidoreductase n=1 Tax=Rhodococcus sp. MSC1_016 TaxID=2909266 RepID=UPI00203075B8|nr:glucose 1-dehydrogenase [Rhodococcus sp. MSC1_016]
MTLQGKVAVVTGGSRGMGKAMVDAFASQGAHVVIASRKVENCETLKTEIEQRYGTKALAVRFNASSWTDSDELFERTLAEFGTIDVLVNNAGLSPLYSSLTEVSESLFDKVLGVNLKGPFRLTALAGEHMATHAGGSIINIGSVEAVRPSAQALPYAAAKAGLHVLTEGFAKAYGPSVRVNTIQCGPFLTDISEAWTEEMRADFESDLALERCGRPEEVVGAVLYFASDASSFTTGAVLRVDGGAL